VRIGHFVVFLLDLFAESIDLLSRNLKRLGGRVSLRGDGEVRLQHFQEVTDRCRDLLRKRLRL